jgi:hypothetical protein
MPTQPTQRPRPDQPPRPRAPRPPKPTQPRASRPPKPTRPRGSRPPVPTRERGSGTLSHFANRTNWNGVAAAGWRALVVLASAAGLAGRAGRWAVALAAGELGRRIGRAVALAVALAVVVVVLYDQGEVPSAAARPALAAPAGRPAATARLGDPGDRGGLRGRARPARVGERPAEVAAAWYAARSGVPRSRVKPLQQDRLSASEVRVLVLADHGHGRLRTALVRLRRGPDGWSVR